MKSAFAVAAIGAVSALEGTSQQQFEFMQFIANHGKSYQTAKEFGIRFARYVLADAYIVANNANPKSTHVASHNPLSDSTEKEFSKMLGTSEKSESDHHAEEHQMLEGEILTGTKNWTGSCSTPVKDQGQCGSCWSFAGTTVVETAHCIKTNALLTLAPQQNVDCNTGCYGCDGGWAYKAFNYFKTYGAELESAYPYTGVDGTCKYSASKSTGIKTTGYKSVAANTTSMISAANNGPLAVAINASSYAFQTYKSGVLSGTCSTSCNHAVTLVGYNTDASTPYWIVRNSWGSSWGAGGFIWMAQKSGAGQCGINTQVNYPTM